MAATWRTVVYFYTPSRGGEHAETFLTGFDGILWIDGYPGYTRLTKPKRRGGDPITVAHCWAYARRKLREVVDRNGSAIALDRRNAPFAGHDEGGKALIRIASLIETAKINGVEPFASLSTQPCRRSPRVIPTGASTTSCPGPSKPRQAQTLAG
ncbi:MAG: transposase [Pseudomonadota bacterium]